MYSTSNCISKALILLFLGLGISQIKAQDRTVTFKVKGAGVSIPITWSLDLAWRSEENIRCGIAFMGADRVEKNILLILFVDECYEQIK